MIINRIKFVLPLLFYAISFNALSQSSEDAIRNAQSNPSGTAKYMALGGAFTSLGGDASGIRVNPAGIAVYNASELTLTPDLSFFNIDSKFNNTQSSAKDSKFSLGNFGLVGYYERQKDDGWINVNFGLNFQHNYSNYQTTSINGHNPYGSLLSVLKRNSDGYFPDGLDLISGLAFSTYLLDTSSSNQYFTQIGGGGSKISRKQVTSGFSNETGFSVGGNYKNRLYIGATVAFMKNRYGYVTNLEERPFYQDSSAYDLDYYNYREEEATESTNSFNLKLGAIYKINEYLRVGASYHSPTIFSFTSTWNYSFDANYNSSLGNLSIESDVNLFEYKLITPAKLNLGVSALFGKRGLFTFDIEHVNYSKTRYRSNSFYDFAFENNELKSIYQSTFNIRIGAEGKINDNWTLRAGYNQNGNPLKGGLSNIIQQNYSFGFGLRFSKYFIDGAYVLGKSKFLTYAYSPDYIDAAEMTKTTNSFLFTFGYRF